MRSTTCPEHRIGVMRDRLWGDLGLHEMETEQSAEAILVRGYELSKKAEVSQTDEGLNVKLFEIREGGIASPILNYDKATIGVKSFCSMLNELRT
jgi:hypothetical protein